ncbi:hypothetical protein GPALN_006208 [Globodera pallida]|nr:hypothetical protein GPALN_006208 [Globodera pallida]
MLPFLDESLPEHIRSLVGSLTRQLSTRETEVEALRRVLGDRRYAFLVGRGTDLMEEEAGWHPDMLYLTCVGLVIFIVLYALRQWIKGAQFREKVSARGAVAIVTGANSGIGKQLVRELNLRYVKVYMACRSVSHGQATVRELFSRYGCDMTRMIVRHCDLTDFGSIREFVEEFNRGTNKLDILINNAGVMFYPRFTKTTDGHELTWQTNFLGHFLLTELLLPKLERSEEGGRIVNVSSRAHLWADSVDPELVEAPGRFGVMVTYARSKLANVMHAVALTKRIRTNHSSSKVSANACHPGSVNTELIRNDFFRKYVKKVLAPLIWFILKTDQDGAQTPLFLALSKQIAGVSGKYYSDCKEEKVHALAEDEFACEILYNNSLEQCGLDQSAI